MKISTFINSDFKNYAIYDTQRSIANLLDGLKITERKLLHIFIKDIGFKKMVVDKAAMQCAYLSKYHHGATSMMGVLVNMNKDYPGTNNIPLFDKTGQFGSRLKNKASSERYISTQLNDSYKKLFDPADELILIDQFDDGDKIEPRFFLPKLPLLLLNGSEGTGNGYSSKVLSYEPSEVKQAVLEVLSTGLVQTPLTPFLRGYEGDISKNHETGQVTYEGVFKRVNSTTIEITELPPHWELSPYRTHLNSLMQKTAHKNGDVISPFIKDYDNESTEKAWKFIIDVPRTTTSMTDVELMALFKLTSRDTENLVAWLPNNKLQVFPTVENMVEVWVKLRLEFYEVRRTNEINRISEELDWLNAKMRFIIEWNASADSLVKLSKSNLRSKILTMFDEKYIDRLLAIRISNLTLDEVKALEKEISKYQSAKKSLEKTTNTSMMTSEVSAINF